MALSELKLLQLRVTLLENSQDTVSKKRAIGTYQFQTPHLTHAVICITLKHFLAKTPRTVFLDLGAPYWLRCGYFL